MNELPPGWALTTLGELGRYLNGRGFKRSEWASGGRPIIRIQNLTGTGASHNFFAGEVEDRYIVQPGDLLVSWAATLGAFLWSGPEAVLNQHIFKVESSINKRFHYYLIQLLLGELYRHTHGSGMVHITKDRFDRLPVALPPLAEQRRIVDALDDHLSRLDAATSGVQRSIRRTMRFEGSLLHSAVAGRLATRRGEGPTDWLSEIYAKRSELVHKRDEAAAPVKVPGYHLPTGWRAASLDEVSYASGYGTSAKCDYNAGGSAVLRIPNIQGGEVVLDDLKSAVDPTLDLSNLYLSPGDILFIRTNGSRDLIGRMAVVREMMDTAFASYLIRFRLVPEGIPADWVRLVVSSPLWREYLERRAASSAGQHNLSTRVLAPLAIPVPPPEELADIQNAVEQFLTVVEVCRRTCQSLLRRSAALRHTLLSEAFAGRLVSQDTGDEPASALLERIRQERGARPKPQRRRRRAPEPQEEEALL